jgi:O-antigen ligase
LAGRDYDAPVADGIAIAVKARATEDASVAASAASLGELGLVGLMLLPGALIVFLGFNAGGYFPGTPAVAALILTQILLVRIVQARHPFEGLAPASLVAIGALGCYAALTLASGIWSHSTSRALIEFDRAWMYLLVLVLFATVRASTANMRWLVRGLVLGSSIVCIAGLLTRLLPNVWHTAPGVSNQRLSYPVTYWNTLGLLAALGIVLAFHLSCSLGERRLVRVLAAGVLPLLAATLFFTFSRGAILAGAIGLVVYVLVARPRGLLSSVPAVLPATAALILIAYHANLLDTLDPTTPAAVAQGHRVALAAGVCVLVCMGLRLMCVLVLDPRLEHWTRRPPHRSSLKRGAVPATHRSPKWGAVLASRYASLKRDAAPATHRSPKWGAVLASRYASLKRGAVLAAATVVVVGFFALGASHAVAQDWERFIGAAPTKVANGDLRQRLTDPSNDGRTPLWQVALHGFASSPLHGAGAGMYQTLWDRRRPHFAYVINAHSLYLQAMAELGLPGLLLLLILLGAVLVGFALRARGDQRTLYGALLAAAVVWALHAGVDWDWEMPVVTIGFFAIAGLALSPRERALGPRGRESGLSDLALGSRRGALGPPDLAFDPRGGDLGQPDLALGSRGGDLGQPDLALGSREGDLGQPDLALGSRGGVGTGWVPTHNTRLVLALLCLATIALPVSIVGSQTKLGQAEHALYASNCAAATPAALSSIGWLDVRPEPYEIVGFCDIERGLPHLAVAAMGAARSRDPGSWETYYALAIAQAAAGLDPRANVARALRMNPLEPLTREAARELRGSSPSEWVRRAPVVRAAALKSNDLSIVPS